MPPRLVLALDTISNLRRHGHLAFLVGGCVRDRLLGTEPKDYDIATSASPAEIAELFPRAQFVGAHFGVSLVVAAPGVEVEVATFRSEGIYSDGRRPDQVSFVADPKLDALRRDFSVNGLFEDPFSGQILDYVGGQADLRQKMIRAIGDADLRFKEDHLRMLRAVRFASRLQFSITPETLAAIRAQAYRISLISAERIRDELIRILTEGHASNGLKLLDSACLLEQILPEVKALQGVEQPPEFHPEGDVWTHVLMMLDLMTSPTPALAFGVLLHDVGKPLTFRRADRIRFDGHAEVGAQMALQILQRLKFANEDIRRVCVLVANHMKFKDLRNMRLSTLKRFLGLPDFDELLELHRLDCAASNGYTDAYDFAVTKGTEFGAEQLRPPTLISGADLIAAGYSPGPRFREALAAVETAQLEGEIRSKEEALVLVRSVLEC
jgi:putative nucleotidyltransferase with HDIG domain